MYIATVWETYGHPLWCTPTASSASLAPVKPRTNLLLGGLQALINANLSSSPANILDKKKSGRV